MTFLRIVIPLYLLFAYDLCGKPLSTFPDHARVLLRLTPARTRDGVRTDIASTRETSSAHEMAAAGQKPKASSPKFSSVNRLQSGHSRWA
jgi:hypothetical protein